MTVRYNNRGYIGSSMSRRAAAAYDAGERPLSKWTRVDADEFTALLARFGVNVTMTVREFRAVLNQFGWTSWHHTSSWANRTEFFHPVATFLDTDDLRDDDGKILSANAVTPDMVDDLEQARIYAGHVADFLNEHRAAKDAE